jgi:F-type H+-transporting ATPase subunit alpha
MDEDTRAKIERGRRVREALKQDEHEPLPPSEQIVVLYAAAHGLFDHLDATEVGWAERAVREALRESLPALARRIDAGERLSDEDWQRLDGQARATVSGARSSEATQA